MDATGRIELRVSPVPSASPAASAVPPKPEDVALYLHTRSVCLMREIEYSLRSTFLKRHGT
jgi:hypothetical protein